MTQCVHCAKSSKIGYDSLEERQSDYGGLRETSHAAASPGAALLCNEYHVPVIPEDGRPGADASRLFLVSSVIQLTDSAGYFSYWTRV